MTLEDLELFSMACILEMWSSNGDEFSSFVIKTSVANEAVAELHDRVSVILYRDKEG